jgi:hypothetical protein
MQGRRLEGVKGAAPGNCSEDVLGDFIKGEAPLTGLWFRASKTAISGRRCAIGFLAIIIGTIPFVVHFGRDTVQEGLLFISLHYWREDVRIR